MIFGTEDLDRIDPDELESPPIYYSAIVELVRRYDLNDFGLAVACLNLGYYLGRIEQNERADTEGGLTLRPGTDEANRI